MATFLANKSIQGDENERNFSFHNASAFSTDTVFKSRQDLLDWVQKVGRSLGYVIVTKRSKTLSSGVMTKVNLMCDRGGVCKSKSSVRNRGTKKINCPFELIGKYWEMYNVWTLRVVCEKHNHEPILHMEDHPYAMRLSANETRLVFDLSRKNVKPHAILSTLKEQNKNNVSKVRTIYNACHKFRKTQHAEPFTRQVVNGDVVDPAYTFDANKLKRTVDHTDSFAINYQAQALDSAKHGPDTKFIETNHVNNVSVANPVRDDVIMYYDGDYHTAVESTYKEDKKVDSDVEVEIKHDKGEYVEVQCNSDMEEDYSQYDSMQMASFHTNESTQGGENERNSGVDNISAFLTDMVFKSRQDLLDWVQKTGCSLGYVIVTKRSRTLPSGIVTNIALRCDRGGIYKSKSSYIRNRGSKKTNCPFELVGKYWKTYDVWTLRVICEDHNHEPTPHVKDHPYARRLSANETRLVFDLSRKNVKPHAILSTLKEQNKNNVSTIKTIYNACYKFQRIQTADTFTRQPVNGDERASPIVVDPVYTFDANKLKRTIDHTDPFAIKNQLQELDSAKNGHGAKDTEELLLQRKQMPRPSFTSAHSLQADLTETNHVKDVSIANHVRDGVVTYYNGNEHNTNASDADDESTFDSDTDVEIKNDKGEYVGVQCNSDKEEDYSQHDSKQMASFLTNRSFQGDENERNFGVHKTSAFSTNMVFKSRQDLIDWAHKVGRSLGYVIVTKRSTTLPSGVMTKIHLMCDRGGIYKRKSSNIRNSGSKKTNCPFRLGGKYWKKYDVWTLRVICEDHNHEPTLHVKDHPYARRLSANETRLVFDLSRKNVKPQAILSTLKEQNENNMSTLKTVYNARQKFRRTQTNTPVDSTDKEDKNVDSDADVEIRRDKGEYVGVQSDSDIEEDDSQDEANVDGLADIWNEMTVGLESSKDADMDLSVNQHGKENEEECDHSFIMKEDIGYVCRVCGVVERSIESIIEFQHPKRSKSTKTYHYEGRSDKPRESAGAVLDGVKTPGKDFSVVEVSAHPRHKNQMKPHQTEGFNFLVSNLVSDDPGGCILAHAPGSGKTFMLISFIQSFMAKYPDARPLVVLPRGIVATWKKEFKRWQVEDIPLFDFYSQKADNRAQQLEVLKQWANTRSILFLSYKQFSIIVCDNDRSTVSATCQEILLTFPSLVILDEGHTPRNKDTDVFTSVEKVQTPRKVVLSGTLYQNHVCEVFNILNLVRPRFLKMEDSKTIRRRIMSRVSIETRRNLCKKNTDIEFCELVEHTLLKDDENFKRKVTIIEDLREMTKYVLHYYKGDFLEELPGHVDFSVFLNLTMRQRREVNDLKNMSRKFKVSADGSALYVHPELKSLVNSATNDKNDDTIHKKIDALLENLDESEGVKAKFFLNLLRLCESSGEKLLVFGNYLFPLTFLLQLTKKVKGWRLNKEIFMITGDHDNEEREVAVDAFNNTNDAKVFFGSIKACGEGISLVGASRVIILDVHLNPSVTRQAIGRAFRPGQVRKVYTYRLVAAGSPEEKDHTTCYRKESIAKMWFEYNEYCGKNDFEMEKIDIKDCGDRFLETPWLNEDVTALYTRS
ncbi:putative DNA helicase chromatin remodeling SNF2 family [Helianthus annuus]|nr:uncharacterized protein LOC110929169 [Helianthus annuus]XP_022027982.1 uncharacterized protein LOC110929169 [Helianthus annuus]XP_035843815.1 uncharacterized protein LOC110929169 [Helianthus annuus]KAJ0600627.1 putative DNA helicase chromatin remodeling SNF2 family [Helianthus annuus]